MDIATRMEIEGEMMLAVDRVLSKEPSTPKQFEKAIERLQKPLEDQYELAMVMLLIMFAEQYPDSPLGEELVKKNSDLDKEIRKRAQKLASRQVKHLNRLVQRTNRRAIKADAKALPVIGEDAADEALSDRIWGKERVQRIAITETTKAINIGEHEAVFLAKRFAMNAYAVWMTSEDERVCNICQPFHNTTEEVWGEEFPYGGPAHVKCRCSLVWYIKDPDQEN